MPKVKYTATKGLFQESGSGVQLDHAVGAAIAQGAKRSQTFAISLANTDTASAYANEDSLVEIGALDTTNLHPSGLGTASKIVITKMYFFNEVAAGQTLLGSIKASATTGTATNVAPSTPTEIMGAGATHVAQAQQHDSTGTAEDLNFNATAGTIVVTEPYIVLASTLRHLYLCTTTALNANATAGRYTLVVEYLVL